MKRRAPQKQLGSGALNGNGRPSGASPGRGSPSRRMRGGQKGNKNAQKYESVGMPAKVDVLDSQGFRKFIKHVITRMAERSISGRDYGTMSNWANLLADVSGWKPKAPITVIHPQPAIPSEEAIVAMMTQMLSKLPTNLQLAIWDHVKRDTIQPIAESSSKKQPDSLQ